MHGGAAVCLFRSFVARARQGWRITITNNHVRSFVSISAGASPWVCKEILCKVDGVKAGTYVRSRGSLEHLILGATYQGLFFYEVRAGVA
jgi:hypothetical protein